MKKIKQTNFSDERVDIENRITRINDDRTPLVLILDSITDPRNVGSIFRIADASRLAHIYFYNCSLNINSRHFKKTARSCDKYLAFSEAELEDLKKIKKKYKFIGVDKTNSSLLYSSFKFTPPTALVLGSEQRGISPEILSLCEHSVHIPMMGINTSLNVANATAVVVFEYLKKIS